MAFLAVHHHQTTNKKMFKPQKQSNPISISLSFLLSQQKIIMDPLQYNEVRSRPSLEERLESIISGAALMADSTCTRDDRRERIVQECNAVRQALQDLLTEYMNNVSSFDFIYLIRKMIGLALVSEFMISLL